MLLYSGEVLAMIMLNKTFSILIIFDCLFFSLVALEINNEHVLQAQDYLLILAKMEKNEHYYERVQEIFCYRRQLLKLKSQEWCNACRSRYNNEEEFYRCLNSMEQKILGKNPLFCYCASAVISFALLDEKRSPNNTY